MSYDLKRLEQISMEIGYGENRFPMKRGSFVYRRSVRGMQPLRLRQKRECPNGFLLEYAFLNGAPAGALRHPHQCNADLFARAGDPSGQKRFPIRLPLHWLEGGQRRGLPAIYCRYRAHL